MKPRFQLIPSVRHRYYAALIGGPTNNTIIKTTTSRLVGTWWRIRYGEVQGL